VERIQIDNAKLESIDMESFQWDACFVTGLEMVDEQHHKLVDVINRFGNALMLQGGAVKYEVDTLFGELADYTKYHFREEEEMMHRVGLDGRHIVHHRGEHEQFLKDVTYMHASLDSDNRDSGSTLLTFLTNWLAYHILGTDHHMARLIQGIKSGETARTAFLSAQKDKDPATAMLLRSMTALFNQVSERNRALFELNRTLEARVEARTRELSNANERLESMAMTDVLTNLPNRRHAMLCLSNEWKKSVDSDIPLSCMMIDADGFKAINDQYGHDAGDEVLRELSKCLRRSVRNDDIVCRLGGDEFLIICGYTDLHGAMKTAQKLRAEVAQLRVPAGSGCWVGSVSVGVAQRSPDMQFEEDLLKRADEGVYAAKNSGRDCVSTLQAQ
jgi:hemerythrin